MVQPVLYDLVDSAQQRLFGGRLRGFFDSKRIGIIFRRRDFNVNIVMQIQVGK